MRRLLTTGIAALGLLAATALPAAATARGGWATSTLDGPPGAEPGHTSEIGFTILQHGVTPVNVEDVAVIIDDQSFPAVQQGEVGHYVAEVTWPDEGRYDWAIRQGWFGDHPLGTLNVGGDPAPADAGSWWSRTSWPLKALLVLPIVAAAGLYVLDRSRRRRPQDEPVAAGA